MARTHSATSDSAASISIVGAILFATSIGFAVKNYPEYKAALGLAGAQSQNWQQCENRNKTFSADQQIDGCTGLIQSRPESSKILAAAFENRGNAYLLKRDYDRAIADFAEVIRLDPDHAPAYNNRCFTRAIQSRELTQALDDCNKALRLQPNDADVLNSRGLVQFQLGAFDRSIADYDAAVKQQQDANSLYGRGMAKLKTGDATGGNRDIAAAKELQADIAEVYAGYGIR